jgi:hypothetical protein
LRVALRGPDGSRVADGPDEETCDPQPQAEADRAASVPLTMATVRGAPPSRIGSVSARCTGA